jgi:hypothetical protein
MYPCANCAQQTERKPFCSDDCKMIADNVRMMRQWIRSPEKQADSGYDDAFVPRIGKLYSVALGWGYGIHQPVTGKLRDFIMERDGYKCQIRIAGVCTIDATQIDHIAGPSMEPSNLQASCRPCNMNKVVDSLGTDTNDVEKQIMREFRRHLAERVESKLPLNACDDEQNWRFMWRKYPQPPDREIVYVPNMPNVGFANILSRADRRKHEMMISRLSGE